MSPVGSWGYFMQGNGAQRNIDRTGSELSKHLDCPVHYPAYGKRLFECRCGVLYPVYVVDYAVLSGDWSSVDKLHKEGFRPTELAY